MGNLIELKNVVRNYNSGAKTVTALKGINLTIQDGQSAAIIGPSGSGKSTMLQILGALDKSDSGEIIIDGKNITKMKSDEELSKFRNNTIGFIFQFFNLTEYLTALQNVAWPLLIAGKKEKEAYAKAKELLARVGLSSRINHYPKEMSGGEMQRVAIARSLANSPKLILADEPTGNLDKENRENILSLFDDITREGVSIIVVTHDHEVSDHFEKLIHLRHGELAKS